MTTMTQNPRTAAFLLSEGSGEISRDVVTIASGQNLKAGSVLGKITATGKFSAYNNSASDGREVAAGVLYDACDATSGDQRAVAIVRLAEVATDLLVFRDDQDGAARAAAIADLAALNIIAR